MNRLTYPVDVLPLLIPGTKDSLDVETSEKRWTVILGTLHGSLRQAVTRISAGTILRLIILETQSIELLEYYIITPKVSVASINRAVGSS